MRRAILLVSVLAACRSKRDASHDETVPVVVAPGDAARGDPPAWPELATFPTVEPRHVVHLPSRADVPRFEVGGPAISGDIAIVASSQLGFAGVDWRRGVLVWTKPAGAHVAPPVARGGEALLIADCVAPPTIPAGETLLGCLRTVTSTGTDAAYIAIHGKTAALEPFATATGTQDLWLDGDRAIRWRRGEAAVSIDTISGIALPASATPPPLVVTSKDHRWELAQIDGRLVASEHGHEAWSTQDGYTALLGAVYLPDQAPLIRVANIGAIAGTPKLDVLDLDATGSLHGQAALPVPGIGVLGFGASSIGDVAIAVRLDRSIQRDFIVGYAANAVLMWVYPLPELPRADPVGIALADGAVVVFHDGETVTILPELSAPPTSRRAARAPSQNPTP